MLILTRKISEAIVIGDDTRVTILSVKGNQVRIGIAAPKDISVHREEVYAKILAEKQPGKITNKKDTAIKISKNNGFS